MDTNPYAPPTEATPKSPSSEPQKAFTVEPGMAVLRWLFLPMLLSVISFLPFFATAWLGFALDREGSWFGRGGFIYLGALMTGAGAFVWVWAGSALAPSRRPIVAWALFALGATLVLLLAAGLSEGTRRIEYWAVPLVALPSGVGAVHLVLQGRLPGTSRWASGPD